MRTATRSLLSIAALGLAASGASADSARYEVTFQRTWSAETHPKDFPPPAHFSPVIGVTHGADYTPFARGAAPTAGLEKLCEMGKHQPLDGEIRAAIAEGKAGALIETSEPIRTAPGAGVASFEIDDAHPDVTIAAMIAPSPDWCAVAAGVPLRENGGWVAKKTVNLYAWDAGTDSARSYQDADADMQPRGTVQPSDSPYFTKNGSPLAVGTVTFVRK
jgi:hypothetical protein